MVAPQAMASWKSEDMPMDKQFIDTLSNFFAAMST